MARTVLVTGLGLMGGSLAAALSAAGWTVLLHHRRKEVADKAEALGYGRAIGDFAEAATADIAVVCTPVASIPQVARTIAAATASAKKPPVITDIGSTKGALCADLADLGGRFVGSHPMAGSHLQGLEHADARLYQGRVAIITPTPATPAAATAVVEDLWHGAGCRLIRLDPDQHDRLVAEASHLPHVLAAVAAMNLSASAAPLAAGGFRDTTRVAAGSPEIWSEILLANHGAVLLTIAWAQKRLDDLRAALQAGDQDTIARWLAAGGAGRARFEAAQPPAAASLQPRASPPE